MNKTLLTLATGTLLLSGLAACRSGDGNGNSSIVPVSGGSNPTPAPTSNANATANSSFTSTDQGAQLASAIANGVGGTTISGTLSGGSMPMTMAGTSPAAMRAKSASVSPKSSSDGTNGTTTCNGGGTDTFTGDTTTTYIHDGLDSYASCTLNLSDSSASTNNLTFNGKDTSKCTDSAQTTSACNASTDRLADGAAGSTDFVLHYVAKSSTSNQDFTISARGDTTDVTSGSTDTSTLTGTQVIRNNLNSHQYTEVADGFKDVSVSDAQGGSTESYSGGYGISSNTGQCAIGKVTVATNTPLTFVNEKITAGKLTLTDSARQSITVEYASDSSVKVTLANGTTKTYTAAQIASLCQ